MRAMMPEDYALKALNIKWQYHDITDAMKDAGLELDNENLDRMYDEIINLRGEIIKFVNKRLRDIAGDIRNEYNSCS